MSENQPGLARRVALNTAIQFAGRIGGAITAILVTRLIAEALGVAGYGRYTTIFAYITFFGAIADFGFFWYLVREVAKNKEKTESITANVLTLRLIFALLVLVLGAVIAFSIPRYDSEIRIGIILLAASMLWVTFSSTLIGVFQANERMDYPVTTEIIGRVASLGLVWYVVSRSHNLIDIVYATLAGSFVIFVLNLILVRRFVKIRLGFDFSTWKDIMRENIPLGLNVLLSIIYFKIDAVLLSAMKPSVDVGIYGAAYKVLEILLAFPAIFMGTVFPSLARVINTNSEKAQVILQKAFDLLAMAGWGAVGGMVALASQIISFTTKGGQDFLTSATVSVGGLPITAPVVLQILSVAVGLSFLSNLFLSTIVAQGSQRKLVIGNIINAVLNVVLNLIFIRYFSYLAAAGLSVLSEIVMLTFLVVILYKAIHFLPKLAVFWKSGLCALVMGIGLFYIRDTMPVLLSTLVGGLLYIALLVVTGCLNRDMVSLIRHRGDKPVKGTS